MGLFMSQKSFFQKNPFILWLTANIIGFGVLGAAILLFPEWMSQSGVLGSTFIIAILVSLTQLIFLRKLVSFSWLWIIAMPVGLTLANLLMRAIPESFWLVIDDESIAVLVAGYLVMGFLIGFPQWLLLRIKFSRASLWLPGTAIGLAFGTGLVLATNLINYSRVISFILVVLGYATVTGLILTRLPAKPGSTQMMLPNVL